MDCPELRELAAYLETGEGEPGLLQHIKSCEACTEALETLEDEVMSLQISISDWWFREKVSCPHADVLSAYLDGSLKPAGAVEYVVFHVDDLECSNCQARLAEIEAKTSSEGRRRLEKSRTRVGEATSVLIDDLTKKGS